MQQKSTADCPLLYQYIMFLNTNDGYLDFNLSPILVAVDFSIFSMYYINIRKGVAVGGRLAFQLFQ